MGFFEYNTSTPMARTIAKWLLNALVLTGIPYLVSGFEVSSFSRAVLVALVLGLINATLKPLLVLLTLPINILTLGLFTFVINALLLMLVSWMLDGFEIAGFGTALIGALLISVANWIIGALVTKD